MGYIITLLALVANWMIFKKMGRQGWEGIIPFYNTYVLFEELYGNGWKFLLLLIPIYNIYIIFKLYIDLAHAFNKSTGFGVGLVLLSIVFLCLLAFGNDVYKDGSKANNEEDFVSNAVDAVGDFGAEVADNIKEKVEEAGGVEGIKEDLSQKVEDFADDVKDVFKRDTPAGNKTAAERISELYALKEQGLITEEEFLAKRSDIIDKL